MLFCETACEAIYCWRKLKLKLNCVLSALSYLVGAIAEHVYLQSMAMGVLFVPRSERDHIVRQLILLHLQFPPLHVQTKTYD